MRTGDGSTYKKTKFRVSFHHMYENAHIDGGGGRDRILPVFKPCYEHEDNMVTRDHDTPKFDTSARRKPSCVTVLTDVCPA